MCNALVLLPDDKMVVQSRKEKRSGIPKTCMLNATQKRDYSISINVLSQILLNPISLGKMEFNLAS